MRVCFRLFHFSLAVTAIVAWPTVTEITVKKITRRLSLWVEFPSGGGWFHIAVKPLLVSSSCSDSRSPRKRRGGERLCRGCPGSVPYQTGSLGCDSFFMWRASTRRPLTLMELKVSEMIHFVIKRTSTTTTKNPKSYCHHRAIVLNNIVFPDSLL